jgi:hypothetical protein
VRRPARSASHRLVRLLIGGLIANTLNVLGGHGAAEKEQVHGPVLNPAEPPFYSGNVLSACQPAWPISGTAVLGAQGRNGPRSVISVR